MKRASLFSCLLLTLTGSINATAEEDIARNCAEAAFEVTGDIHYEVTDVRTRFYGFGRDIVTLMARDSGTEVTCKVRRGRIIELTTTAPANPAINPVIVTG